MLKKISLITCLLFALAAGSMAAKGPKYVFIFIGDGMGIGSVQATDIYQKLQYGPDTSLLMMRFPVAGFSTTYCLNKWETDSPAAGTAIANGVKTMYGYQGIGKEGQPLTSFFQVMKKQGRGIGVLTTNAPDDATPAAFYASVKNRNQRYQIATDAAKSGFDFFGGARWRGDKAQDAKELPVHELMKQHGYAIAEGMDEFAGIKEQDKVILLSQDTTDMNAIGLMIDEKPGALKLSEMTQACLDHLTKRYSKKGFCMMVESGDIDHTNHVKDVASTIHEVLEFEKAIGIAYDFYRRYPKETLIIVTADHETGGLTVGANSSSYSANLAYAQHQKVSEITFGKQLSQVIKEQTPITWPDMKTQLTEKFGFWKGIPLTLTDEARLMTAFEKACLRRQGKTTKTLYNSFDEFTIEIFNILNDKMAIGWTTWSHTGNPVPFFAAGAGSSAFSGVIDNAQIVNILYDLMGLKNPNL